MALERKWFAAQSIATSDGNKSGLILIADTVGFYVGQFVDLASNTVPQTQYKVRRVEGPNQIWLGDPAAKFEQLSDLTKFLLADSPTIKAYEQKKPSINLNELDHYTYELEPILAKRVIQVDKYGNKIGSIIDQDGNTRTTVDTNIDAFTKTRPDNAIAVGTSDGTLSGTKMAMKMNEHGSVQSINMGQLVPKEFDRIDVTNTTIAGDVYPYIVQYYQTASLVATLTISYDPLGNITGVVRS